MKLRAPDPAFGKPRKPKKPVYPPNIGLHVHKFTYDEADRLYYENNKVTVSIAWKTVRLTLVFVLVESKWV